MKKINAVAPENSIYAPEAKSSDSKVLLTIKIPESIKTKFQKKCDDNKVTMSVVMRRLIEREINHTEES